MPPPPPSELTFTNNVHTLPSLLTTSLPGKSGILKDAKRDKSGHEKKRGITFPDYEELQEIIGYGGECYYSSEEEEDDTKRPVERFDRKSDKEYLEEMTAEERNIMTATKKNTTFNSHAQNLKEAASPPVKLGQEKKHTPIISVRPFVRDATPGKVINLVSPMINGELVKPATKADMPKQGAGNGLMRKLSHDDCGRGEVKTLKTDSLGSDGSTENSSDSDSNMRDSPPPHPVNSFIKKTKETVDTNSVEPFNNRLAEDIKSSAAVARLADLDQAVSAFAGLQAAKLSLSVHSSSHEETKNTEGEPKKDSTARLSFLHSTIQSGVQPDPELSATLDNEKDESERKDDSEPSPSKRDMKASDNSETIKTRDSPKVKLTRKSPYVCGPYASTAILKARIIQPG